MKPRDIAFSERALVGPSGGSVRVRWLGTAGFELEHDGWVVLFDPYFSRPSLAECFAGPLSPDVALIRRHVRRVDAIVCSHTHFDHVLDVPTIARMTGARVFGSRSAVRLCRAANVQESQLVDVEAGTTRAEVGPFRLSFVSSAHSPLLLGRVPFPGDIADCDELPLSATGYRCGAVFATLAEAGGRSVYHVGSANLDDAARPPRRDVDLLLLCAAGWTTTERFAERMLRAVSPGAIALSHWDNFFRPLEHPATPLPALKLPRLVESLHHEARGVRTGTLDLLHDLWV
jgi:L-ascorbate metabolism protein UlaG (beta-lactamase superfamily)